MRVNDPARPLRTLVLDGKPHAMPTDTEIQTATVVATMQGDTLTVSDDAAVRWNAGERQPENH